MGWMVNHVQVGDRSRSQTTRSAGAPPSSPGSPAAGLVRGWVLQGLAAEREGSVEQTVEALSRDVAWLRRQLTERQAS